MTDRQVYSAEQLQRLVAAHKTVCEMRGVNPRGQFGFDIAIRLLNECDGSEEQAYMVRRFTH
jgi:hypothetical protein